jgi:transposase-like protein
MDIEKIYQVFPDQDSCIEYLEKLRWGDEAQCPYCKSFNCSSMPKESRHHCNNCNTSFSVTVGSIFHKTKLDLQKWFIGILLIVNSKKNISARQLASDLKINKNTASYMRLRIMRAMIEDRGFIKGFIEMNEIFFASKPRSDSTDG